MLNFGTAASFNFGRERKVVSRVHHILHFAKEATVGPPFSNGKDLPTITSSERINKEQGY